MFPAPSGLGLSGGTQRDKSRAGLGTLLQAAHSNWEASAGRPSPTSRDPHHLLSGARNLRGGGPHRTQAFKEQEKRTLAPEATLQPHSKSPRTCHLLSPGRGGGLPSGSSALANYCDVSAPLPGPLLGRVLQDHPPHPHPFPPRTLTWSPPRPHPLFLSLLLPSDRLSHLGDLIMYINTCKLGFLVLFPVVF